MKGQHSAFQILMHHNSLPKGEQFISLDDENKTYVIIWNVCHTHGTRESYKLSAEGLCMLEGLNCGSAYHEAKAGDPKSY
jgi:hypothetical protein